jgi:hypothetical protein
MQARRLLRIPLSDWRGDSMPDQLLRNAYHERAQELRKIAAKIKDEKSRDMLLSIAKESEQMAIAIDSMAKLN